MIENLKEQIVRHIRELIKSGVIDPDCVVQIIVGFSADGQSINIWQSEYWDNYNDFNDEQAIAKISNRDWLDLLDKIGFSEFLTPLSSRPPSKHLPDFYIRFEHPDHQNYFEQLLSLGIGQIKGALRKIAREQLLGEFSKQVGLLGMRISNSGYADLVSIYHQNGADLLPVRVIHLPGWDSFHGQAGLLDDGIVIFYPADEEVEEKISYYLFSDMTCFTLSDEPTFYMENGLKIQLDAGHTHAEWGGPDSVQVSEMLIAHFKKHIPQLYFDISCPLSLQNASAWQQWSNLVKNLFRKNLADAVQYCFENGGLQQAEALVTSLEMSAAEKTAVNHCFLSFYLSQGDYDQVIQIFENTILENSILESAIHEPADQTAASSEDWNKFYSALIMKDEWQKVLQISQEYRVDKADTYTSVMHLSYYVIASFNLQQECDFLSLLDTAHERYQEAPFYIAKLLLSSEVMPCHLVKILSDKNFQFEYAEKYFSLRPDLLKILRFYLTKQNETQSLDASLKALFAQSIPEPKKIDFQEVFCKRWFSESVVMLQYGSQEPFNHDVREVYFISGEYWVRLGQGFMQLHNEGGKLACSQHFASEESYRSLSKFGDLLFAITDDALEIFSCKKGSAPELLSRTCVIIDGLDCLSVDGGLAVISNGKKLVIVDVSDVCAPKLLSIVSLTSHIQRRAYAQCLLLRGSYLYIGFVNNAVCLLDLNQPENVRLISFITSAFPIRLMDELNGILMAGDREGFMAIDFSDPKSPFVIENFSFKVDRIFHVASMSFVGGGSISWNNIFYQSSTKSLALDVWPLFESHYGVSAIIPTQDGFFLCEDAAMHLQFDPVPKLTCLQGDKEKLELENWIRKLLNDYQETKPLGCVDIAAYPGWISIGLHPQKSLVSIGFTVAERKDWQEIWDMDAFDGSEKSSWQAEALLPCLRNLISDTVNCLLQAEFQHLLSGRAYIKVNGVVISLIACPGDWNPERLPIEDNREVPLEIILKDYNNWSVYAAKCDRDLELKTELYQLAREGNRGALQVVRRRLKQDEDDSIVVILQVVEKHLAFFWLDFIDDYTHRQDVQEVCERIYTRLIDTESQLAEVNLLNWAQGLIAVAILLGKQDEASLDTVVHKLLLAPDADYQHYDLATKLLRSKKNLQSLASTIQRCVQTMNADDNRLPDLAEQLFRAGIYEIPPGLIEQARPEKRSEQYASTGWGIDLFDEIEEYDQCRIERLFTGKMLLDNFRRDLPANQSLWPETIALEPWPESWVYLVKSVLEQMDLEKELPEFIQALERRLEYPADRAIFTALFKILSKSKNQIDNLLSMITLIRKLPDIDQWSELHKIQKNTEVNLAWQANAEGNLALSKELTWRLLAEGHESPYLYFLEARLAWKETGDSKVAIERLMPRLKALQHGGTGKAHLLNLLGCAYDEQGQYQEALSFFKQAADMNPEASDYFANIAEIYDKLGDADKALAHALDAQRRGSTAVVLESIINKYQ